MWFLRGGFMRQQKWAVILVFISAILLLLLSTGCGQYVKGEQQEEILLSVEPITDRLLDAIETQDFSKIQPDFSEKLSADLTEDKFLTFTDTFKNALGKFQSREVYHVKQDPEHLTVVYKMVFEQSDQVVLNLIFANDDLTHISGIRFTGPGLQ
jgi:hypothetical protein